VDIDGDGHFDILSGSYSRMEKSMAGLFQVLSGTPDGTFKSATVLNGTDDKPLIIPIEDKKYQTENICTRPTAVDWDADGDLDLVVGNFAGSFYLFEGKGKGVFFPKPRQIMADTSPLKINGAHSDPFAVDWDSDGDLDLLSGSSSGGVQWAENTAGKGNPPELKQFQTLIEAGKQVAYGQSLSEDDLTGPTRSTRIWVDDVNSDGKLDLLVGDSLTLVAPAKGLTEEEFKKKHADWQEKYQAASKAMQSTTDAKKRQEANKRFYEVYNKRSEFMNEQRTGFVWLYVQK
jgi:hypothetical protein